MKKLETTVTNKLIRVIFLILLSALFLVSAVTKLINIPLFETTVYASGIPLQYAEIVSRLILIAELGLTIFLILVIGKKDFLVLLLTFLFLTVFDISLIIEIIKTGGKDNCGCFGDVFVMDSQTALIKNIVIQLIMFPFLLFGSSKSKRHFLWFLGSLIVVAIITLVTFPIHPVFSKMEDRIAVTPLSEAPLGEIDKEKLETLTDSSRFLIFVHYGCGHCKKLTQKLNHMKDNQLLPPTTLVLYGKPEKIEDFIKETKNTLPTLKIDQNIHLKTTNGVFPGIYLYHNDSLHGKWRANHFDPEKIYLSLGITQIYK